ncbi:unnamed protein product [Rotaria sp. Silwood2]|nr:unnamed protein product [Rotaria sp. Silwood2]
MDPKEVENIINYSSSSISISQPSTSGTSSTINTANSSLINTSMAGESRRSGRLSAKFPKAVSLTSNQSTLHRTISGGVDNNRSPKLNIRKRILGNTDTNIILPSSSSSSSVVINDNGGFNDNNNNSNHSTSQNLPSDQSDDDEMSSDNNVVVQQKTTGLASRAQVLSYFVIQDKGYKCKLCSKASLVFKAFKCISNKLI